MTDRKARLAALAAKAGRTKTTPKDEEQSEQAENGSTTVEQSTITKDSISFRNYAPADNALDKKDGKDNNDDNNDDDDDDAQATKRQRVGEKSSALDTALMEAKHEISASTDSKTNNTTTTITSTSTDMAAPKKINWDLKRDIQSKFAKLEKRTQKAIVELLKQRLEHEAENQTNSDGSDLD